MPFRYRNACFELLSTCLCFPRCGQGLLVLALVFLGPAQVGRARAGRVIDATVLSCCRQRREREPTGHDRAPGKKTQSVQLLHILLVASPGRLDACFTSLLPLLTGMVVVKGRPWPPALFGRRALTSAVAVCRERLLIHMTNRVDQDDCAVRWITPYSNPLRLLTPPHSLLAHTHSHKAVSSPTTRHQGSGPYEQRLS